MTKIGRIIRELRERKGWSQSRLARLSEISNAYMNCIEMENEAADNIGLLTLGRIAKALDVNYTELFSIAEGVDGSVQRRRIPVLGFVNSLKQKRVIEWDSHGHPVSCPIGELNHTESLPDPNSYALIVKDDSMDPIGINWAVIASPSLQVGNNDLVVVEMNKKLFLRKIQIRNNMYLFYAVRNSQEPILVPKREIKILHKIVAVIGPDLTTD